MKGNIRKALQGTLTLLQLSTLSCYCNQ